MQRIPMPITIYNVDHTENKAGKIEAKVKLTFSTFSRSMKAVFLVTALGTAGNHIGIAVAGSRYWLEKENSAVVRTRRQTEKEHLYFISKLRTNQRPPHIIHQRWSNRRSTRNLEWYLNEQDDALRLSTQQRETQRDAKETSYGTSAKGIPPIPQGFLWWRS